jgi:class 3 adenylate cyclase/tetratricopeptide (TPR) repeat protein
MTCSACQHENRVGAAFCEECGARLERRCPSCGEPCAPAAKFCSSCGTSLAARPAQKPEEAVARKVVTIVFADLIGSTALHERLDPESVSRVMERYHRAVRGPVEAHGGTVVQLLGDGVMCAFGVPRVAEDDAIRAVRAAVAVQRAFREFAREERTVVGTVGLRVAVNTGEVVVSDDYAAGIGDPLNVAARLQQEARDGDVLIGESTERLVRELVTLAPIGRLSLKGRSETVMAYRVVSLDRPGGASATAFVGREDELRRIMATYEAAVASRRARLAVILGSPGLGKSRLMDEVARRLGDAATVLTAHCEAAGGATFAPIARALRAHLRIDDTASGEALRAAIEAAVPGDEAERSRIAGGIAALLAGTPASPEETFFVVRRLLAALAAVQPVVLAIDDLHWAEPLLLDLTEHLVQWSTDVPLLVLAAARPELREARSSLAAPGALVADVVTLAGLDAGAATRLAANVIGATELPAAVAGRVLATSEGNPLFVGELVRMLVADGALKREGDRWTTGVELARLEMPPTIQALLAARIERLRPEERTVLERAAVVGRQFSRAAVTHLLPRDAGDLDARLEALRRSELIEPDPGWFLGEPALRFHHVLVRDAAYRRLLRNTRAELHARFADWLEARVGDAVEHEETIGWHLEQAHQHLRELGPVDERGRALGDRAARYLAAAGRRALARDDLPPAASLLGRALDRLDPTDPTRAELTLDWCEALLAAGDVGPAARAIDELGRFAGDSARLGAWHTCFAGQRAALTDPQALRATADAVAAAAETLAESGDAAGEAKAHSVHALALARLGRVGACEAALDRALAAARRARDHRRSNAVLASVPLAALWGPSPVTRASGRCLDVVRVLRITQGAPAVEAVALRCQGVLEALRGRTEAARRMLASSRRMVEELGITQRLLEADVFAGLVELLEGDAVAAERSLRTAYDGLRGHGLGIDAAQAGALLGRALLALDRAEEAEAVSRESEALAGDDLKAAIAWRGVRAEALARRGEPAAAVDFARTAVDLAAATDALLDHADARLALAAALRAAGRSADAAAEEARAIELWEAKGATLLAERARRDAGRAVPAARGAGTPVAAAPRVERRVHPNAASAVTAGLEAAFRARDLGAIDALCGDPMETVDHPTGATYGREGMLDSSRRMMRRPHLEVRLEALATLGESLCLCRRLVTAPGTAGGGFDVAEYEMEHLAILELDEVGRCGRIEVFAPDHLGEAIGRFYERYAELLPDGPAREGAVATARSVATLVGPRDAHSHDAVLMGRLEKRIGDKRMLGLIRRYWAADAEFVDHRRLGFGAWRGAERMLHGYRAGFEIADDVTFRHDDVLGVRSDVLLVHWTTSGTVRASGGAFETKFFALYAFGADGLVTRTEWFDDDRPDQALARFDELAAGAGASRPPAAPFRAAGRRERRVRPNAATAYGARVGAAVAARDADTLSALAAHEVVDHTTGTVYEREGVLAGLRALMRDRHPVLRIEPLATLGDSLALFRESLSASGFAGARFDVGSFERDQIHLGEVDAQGHCVRDEVFAVDHLADAIARLYERYAGLLPDGPARIRAAATARSIATLVEPVDLDRYATAIAGDFVVVDRSVLGMGSGRGPETLLRAMRALLDVSGDTAIRVDDVLASRDDALLVHVTNVGTVRASGGAYERQRLVLWTFDADGLVRRWEQFDPDRDDEALACFDALPPAPPRVA